MTTVQTAGRAVPLTRKVKPALAASTSLVAMLFRGSITGVLLFWRSFTNCLGKPHGDKPSRHQGYRLQAVLLRSFIRHSAGTLAAAPGRCDSPHRRRW